MGLLHRPSLATAVLLVALTIGCNSSPTAPSAANVAGMWTGTTCAPARTTSCVIQVTIEQTGTSLTGTWGKTTTHGTLTGTVSGATVSLLMKGEFDPFTLTLTVNGNQMSGSYTDQATISLTR